MATAGKRARLARAGVGMSIALGAMWVVGCSSTNSNGRQSCGADGVCNSDCPTTGQFADPDCTDGGGGSSGGSCQAVDSSNSCEVCTMNHCCDEYLACEGSADCVALAGCVTSCSTDACRTDCITAHPSGTVTMLDMADCMDSYCASECGT